MSTAILNTALALAALCFGQQQPTDTSQETQSPQDCTGCALVSLAPDAKPSLKVRWKRRVDDQGTTMPCHAATEIALDDAVAALQKALQPLGIEVNAEKVALSDEDFLKDPLKSNRIWLNGVALASYLPNAKVGSVEGEQEGSAYRTVEFAGQSFRDLTSELIVYAGLAAANESVQQMLADAHALGVANPSATAHLLGDPVAGSSDSCCPTTSPSSCCDDPGTDAASAETDNASEEPKSPVSKDEPR